MQYHHLAQQFTRGGLQKSGFLKVSTNEKDKLFEWMQSERRQLKQCRVWVETEANSHFSCLVSPYHPASRIRSHNIWLLIDWPLARHLVGSYYHNSDLLQHNMATQSQRSGRFPSRGVLRSWEMVQEANRLNEVTLKLSRSSFRRVINLIRSIRSPKIGRVGRRMQTQQASLPA